MHLAVSSYHVRYAFQSEFRLYICLNVKELLPQNRCDIWSLSDYNATGTYNHLVHKLTLNQLGKLTKSSSWIVTTYLYSAFDWMFLSCQVRVSEWIYTLYLPESQGTPCSIQAPCLTFKWLQQNSNPQPLSSETNAQTLGEADQMIELNCEYLFVGCIWLYVLIMSLTPFRVNLHFTLAWMSRNSLLITGTIFEV